MLTPGFTLTEIEAIGLKSQYNFADGHAYHDLSPSQTEIVANLQQIWYQSSARKIKEGEDLYQEAFWKLAESPSLKGYKHFKICPTASNSIDVAATWLAANNRSSALLHPTFDNLYLILKRRGVPVEPLQETDLHSLGAAAAISKLSSDSVFLVNPNNPTGKVLTKEQFSEVVEACVASKKTLLLDNTFRFFVEPSYDQFEILLQSGVSFITIEDTGKVWPTQDMKASLIFYSKDIAQQMEVIYEEIYLCVSNFALGVLTEFLKDAKSRGLKAAVWDEVAIRRKIFREAISGSILSIDPVAKPSCLSVEWVKISESDLDGVKFMKHFHELGLTLLPGQNFFWATHHLDKKCQNIRFSLLKPKLHFLSAVKALQKGLQTWEAKDLVGVV